MYLKTKNPGLLLLPNFFKYVGIAILAITIILTVLFSPKFGFNLADASLASIFGSKLFLINTLIVGLLCLVLAKDKIEDELTIKIRFQAMAFAFITGSLQTVISSILNYFLSVSMEDSSGDYSANATILGMLVMYLLMKTFMKYTR